MTALRRATARPGLVGRLWMVLAVVCAFGLASGLLPGAGAQTGDGGGDDDIDVLTADRDEVMAELDALEQRFEEQQERVDAARADAERAEAAVVTAQRRVEQAEADAEEARLVVREYAVEAYIRPPAQDTLRVLSLPQADDAGFVNNVLTIMAEERHEVVDVLVQKQEAAAREQRAADEAAEDARRRASDAEVQLVELDRVRADRQAFAAQLDRRLDDALAEAAALAAIDQAAADQLRAEELALRSNAPAAPLPVADGGSEPDVGVVGGGGGGSNPPPSSSGGGGGGPAPTSPPTTRPPTSPPPSSGVTWSDVTNVGGIYVHRSIASNVRSLLNAATAAGLNLRGGGYRDPAGQIATRRANCGTSYYDIYQKPASQCTPPTAMPGRSMHERGLAIDFTNNGSLISSRSNPAFSWLSANASRYGLYNLPSEPWHWSTNGN